MTPTPNLALATDRPASVAPHAISAAVDEAARGATVRALATDAACAELVTAWRARAIESILVKGVTTVEWLYRDEPRGYVDADLLVAPDRLARAATVLRELEFRPAAERNSEHAHPWIRGSDRTIIDLHATLWGATRPPARVWRELQDWVEPYAIGGVIVRVPNLPARALSVALHAAQHRDVPAKRADLRRALEHTSLAHWRAAERLADRLGALPLMGAGLQLEPDGQALLRQLPLARAGSLAERDKAALAIGFARIATARGVRGKASVIVAAVAPLSDERAGRQFNPALRFCRRITWLLRGIPRTVISIRRARADGRKRV